jgi:hypothetical protein
MKSTLWASLLVASLPLVSCSEERPVGNTSPFKATLVGEDVSFPLTVGQLLETRHARLLHDGKYKDSTTTTPTIWYYDWQRHPIKDTFPKQAPLYGVSFMFKNKAHCIDSVRQVLEDQFSIRMLPLQVEHLDLDKESLYYSEYPAFVATPRPGVLISLRQASCRQGDYPYPCGRWESSLPPASDNPENKLRLAVSYGLTPIEEERFALGSGRIWERTD